MSLVWDSSSQPWTDEFFKLFRKHLIFSFRKFQTLEQLKLAVGASSNAGGFYLYYGLFSKTFGSLEFIFNVVLLLGVRITLTVIHVFHFRLLFPYRLLERAEQSP